jgi:hypothetical protein
MRTNLYTTARRLSKDVHLKQQFDRIKMFLAFWFGDYKAVVQIMLKTGTEKYFYEKTSPGSYRECSLYFHCALSCTFNGSDDQTEQV